MYSIFSTRIKRHSYLEEGEPPPKKLVGEKDILIKKLSENQLQTSTTLTEQLNKKKEFISRESFTNITSSLTGKTDFKEFQTRVADVDELNNLRNKGLSEEDIRIYKDYINLGTEFWVKYTNISGDVLYQRINKIKAIVTTVMDESDSNSGNEKFNLNPPSFKTDLLQFAAQDQPKRDYFRGPINELPSLEKQFMDNVNEYASCDIKKIRKKARSLGNRVKNLEMAKNLVTTDDPTHSVVKNKNFQLPTQWDIREKPKHFQKKTQILDKDRVYSCKPQNLYTIKDGKIIKINENKTLRDNKHYGNDKLKITFEEIRNVPKFRNYDPGIPSKILFVKNLGKNATEGDLKFFLKQFKEQDYSIKVLRGKMKGQAFIEFQDTVQATEALEVLNGVILLNKPVIVHYGKKNS